MNRRHLTLAILLLALGLVLAGCGGDDDDSDAAATTEASTGGGEAGGSTLNGSVGPGFEISLDGTDGLTAGDYTIVVDDQSSAHNFHLTGPGGVDVGDGRLRRRGGDARGDARAGRVHVRLRPAREPDEGQLHGRLRARQGVSAPCRYASS